MPDNDIQAPEEASAETQEILKELEAEGNEIAGKSKPDDAGAKPDEGKDEAKKEEAKPDEGKADDPDKVDPEKPEAPKPPKPNREPKYVPVGVHNEERHKRQEAERERDEARAEADRLKANTPAKPDKPEETTEDFKTHAKSLAEKHGLEEGFVSDLLETTAKLTAKNSPDLSQELRNEINAFKTAKAELDAEKRQIEQEKGFESEFSGIIEELSNGDKDLESYLASQKKALRESAFAEGNLNTPLRRLAIEWLHDNPQPKPGRKSAEAPGGGEGVTDARKVLNFENVTEKDVADMDPETFEKFKDWKVAQQHKK